MAEPQRGLSPESGFDPAWWRFWIEAASIALGALVLSVLVIWAAVAQHISVEAIVVILVTLVLGLLAGGQAIKSHRQSLALHRRMGAAAVRTTKAAESMIEFLREFTLENQALLSHTIEYQKGRVIEELGKAVDDLARMTDLAAMRHALGELKESIGRKITEIPSGVTFPVPRLEQFDPVPARPEQPKGLPACPACGATQGRLSPSVDRSGVRYTCSRCGHESSLGITVLLEKPT